ncbi:hypothetical protein M8818_000498 [Zalaria obscura]|uniref:Uncharacterized protein n=1 Tax=Zalaria obscura TaxID=2024903 RepID=A0ACC3SPS8_9PEZI
MSEKPTSGGLNQRLNHLLTRTDATTTHLSRLFSTPSGTDTTLLTLCYTLSLLSSALKRLQSLRLSTKRPLLALLTPTPPTLSTLAASTTALSALIADYRIFARLWGLLAIYDWGRETYFSPPSDPVLRAAVWAQVAVNVAYQWYENLAYLAGKGVLRGRWGGKLREEWWWVLSSRFWMAHTALEGVRLLRVRELRVRAEREAEAKGVKGERAGEEAERLRREEVRAWRRRFVVNAAWFPQTVHYSLPKGCLGDEALGLCGLVAGVLGIKQLWKDTAAE